MAQSSMTHLPWRFCAKTKRTCCNLPTHTPWPASDVYSPPHEAGLRKMLCQELSKEGFGRSSSLAPDSTLSLSGVLMAHDRSVSMRWTIPPRRHGNASAWLKLNSHFRDGLISCRSISNGTTWGRRLSAQAFSRTRPRFSLGLASYHI